MCRDGQGDPCRGGAFRTDFSSIRASVSTSATTISNISNPSTTSTPSASSVAANLTTDLVGLLAAAVSTAVIYRVVGSAYLGNTSSWKESVLGGLRKAHSVLWVTVMSIVGYAAIILIPVVIIVLIRRVQRASVSSRDSCSAFPRSALSSGSG